MLTHLAFNTSLHSWRFVLYAVVVFASASCWGSPPRKAAWERLKEVNTSKRYAPLRQVYYSLIMAQWFKARFYGKGGLYSWRIDKKDLANLTSATPYSKETYFKAYQKSFKDGEYNFQTPVYTPYGQVIRSYFSGGIRGIAPAVIPQAGSLTVVDRETGTRITVLQAIEKLSTAQNPYLLAADILEVSSDSRGDVLKNLVVRIADRELTPEEVSERVNAIETAHQIEAEHQLGPRNPDGTYQKDTTNPYTFSGIRQRTERLRDAGFAPEQRRDLMEYGLAGNKDSTAEEAQKYKAGRPDEVGAQTVEKKDKTASSAMINENQVKTILGKLGLTIEDALKDTYKLYEKIEEAGDPLNDEEYISLLDFLWSKNGIKDLPIPDSLKKKIVGKRDKIMHTVSMIAQGHIEGSVINSLKEDIGLTLEEERFLWQVFHNRFSDSSNRSLSSTKVDETVARIIETKGKKIRVLDLGCGPQGKAIKELKNKYSDQVEGWGIDMEISDYSDPTVNLKEGDIRTLPFENDTFDVIYESYVMEYFQSYDEFKKVLGEIMRVLRPFGKFIFTDTNFHPEVKVRQVLESLNINYEISSD